MKKPDPLPFNAWFACSTFSSALFGLGLYQFTKNTEGAVTTAAAIFLALYSLSWLLAMVLEKFR